MRDALIILASAVQLCAFVPYIRTIVQGKTKPNLATWTTWGLINIMVTFAAVSDQAYKTAILTGTNGFCILLIVLLAIRRGTRKYTAFDVACQSLAVVGITAWQIAGHAYVAIAIGMLASVIASLPTFKHAYVFPDEENWLTFALGGAASLLSLLSITHYSFSSVAFPIQLVLSNILLASVIVIRRKQTHKP